MRQFIIRRSLYAIITLFILSLTIFLVVRLTGDPVSLLAEPGARAEDLARVRTEWGLDRPLPVQYLSFLHNIVTGQLGKSFNYEMPVSVLYFQIIGALGLQDSRLPQSFKGGHLRSVGDGVERRDAGPLGDTVDDHGARTAGKMEAVADRQAFPPSAQPSNLEFLRVYKKRSNDQYLHNFDVLPSSIC